MNTVGLTGWTDGEWAMMSFPLSEKFAEALLLAHTWHAGQYRKGTHIPYVSHLLGVASIALEFGATEEQAIAALLHDALEDGPAYTGRDAHDLRAELLTRFGSEVTRLIEGCTDDAPQAGQAKAPWAQRKAQYLQHLPEKDAALLLVSAADKLHNARAILTDVLSAGENPPDSAAVFGRFRQGQEGTLQYYRLLSDSYQAAPEGKKHPAYHALIAEFSRTVTALETACGVNASQVRAYPLLRGVKTR